MKYILFALFFPLALFAQDQTAAFDAYMKAQADWYHFNGNVLLAKAGKILYQKSFGYADFTTHDKLNDNSIFDCGSIAKEFTAVGILLLKDKGKISYSDSLRKFFPELPYNNVTIQQLLTHTSGMPDGFAMVDQYFDHSKIATNEDLVSLLAGKKPEPLFKPGENLMYSGTAFNLLASIIEKISGQPYKTYLMENVFKPLGMLHTQVANGPRSAQRIPGYAYGYLYSDSLNRYLRADSLNTGWTSYLAGITGEGMIITTTGDLFLWDRALKNHCLLKEITQQEMLSLHSQKIFPEVSFGYGIRVGKNQFGNYVFHNGSFPGYLAMHLRYTEDDVTIIVLSNNESHAEFIADGLAAIALGKKILPSYLHKEMKPGIVSGKYTGNFRMELTRPPYLATFPIKFINKGDSLYIFSPFLKTEIRLIPESATKFFYADGTDQQIEFKTGKNENILKAWHIAWGIKKPMEKME